MNQKTYIAFDQYQRYQTIANVISFYRQKNENEIFSVLEIGSNEHKDLRLFLPNDKIVFTDIVLTDVMKEDAEFQQADGTNLSFPDHSFDFVVAADVLEHVPTEKRGLFFRELNRVANKACIICFPYWTEENVDAEERLNVYYKGLYGSDFIWLKEHSICGLPKLDETDKLYSNLDIPYFSFFHGNLRLWEKMWYCHFDTCGAYTTQEYRHTIDHYYNTNIYRSDVAKPCYRVFYVSAANGVDDLSTWMDKQWKHDSINEDILDMILNSHQYMVERSAINQTVITVNAMVSTLYWAREGEPYQESDTHQWKQDITNHDIRIGVGIPALTHQLRFDPMEAPCVVEDLHVYSNQGALSVVPENAMEYGGKYIFLDHDPRFQIFLDGKQVTNIDLRARVTPLEFPEQEELLSLLLQSRTQLEQQLERQKGNYETAISEQRTSYEMQLSEQKKLHETKLDEQLEKVAELEAQTKKLLAKQQELQTTLDHYCVHYHTAIGQREELKQQLVQAQQAYNVISNAFFWKITKPARVLLDCIKRPFRNNKTMQLIGKGLRCWRENGFRYTWRKVQDKLHHRKEYVTLANKALFTQGELEAQRNFAFGQPVKFSIVVPLYNTPTKFLHEMIQSVLDQTYGDWELCMADGSDGQHSDVRKICRGYTQKDSRIKYKKLDKNMGISGNTNACLDMITGDYIALFDHDDLLHPAALYEVMRTISETGADFVFTDEALFEGDVQNIKMVHYKPDFAPDTLRSYNYICHLSVIKTELMQRVGQFDPSCDGSQDFDMVLRLSDAAEKIVHIPEVLYYWRIHSNSVASGIAAKPYCIDSAKKALYAHLKRNGYEGEVLDAPVLTMYRIKYKIKGNPLVSILIPSHDHCDDLRRCIESIQTMSTYTNYEIILIENGSSTKDIFEYYEELKQDKNIKIIYWDKGFNYAAINNYGARHASGEYYLLLNNDTKVITPDWIQEMLMFAQRDDVGAVGAKLYYENGTVQHAGVIVGIGGSAGHSHKHAQRSDVGYMARLVLAQNMSGVTGACLMVSKRAFWSVDGLDEQFVVAFNDVDFCLRLREKGYLNVFTPYAELMHYESLSRGYEDTPEKQIRFARERDLLRSRWWRIIEVDGDPYYNPNLTLDREDFSLK